MTVLYVLVGASLLLGVLNLSATVMLSNSVFRLMVSDRESLVPPPEPERGLVDPGKNMTYDPRFRA